MFIQRVLKGITGIDRNSVQTIASNKGIQCNWWRTVRTITTAEIKEKLSDRNLVWHLNEYDTIDPVTGKPFHENTPFISTTAGTVERDYFYARNLVFPAWLTALRFATDQFTQTGYVFYAYSFVLGKQSIPLMQFSEEVRDLHIYTQYLPYHPEGEIVAKIYIPAVSIEKVEEYDPIAAQTAFKGNNLPSPTWTYNNPAYVPPEPFSNLRGLLAQ
jgi:hypothetical protein